MREPEMLVNWHRVLWIAVVFSMIYMGNCDWSADAAPACVVKATPSVALAPLRAVRVRVQNDAADGGLLELTSEENGLETSSLVQAGVRTTWVEWKNLALMQGDYEVHFLGRTCAARDRVQVAR